MNERTANYDHFHAVGAFIVAAGHNGAWHETAHRICLERDSPDGLIACLGEAFSYMVDDIALWKPLIAAVRKILEAEKINLTHGFLYDRVGEFTALHIPFRAHALSRLAATLHSHDAKRPRSRKKRRVRELVAA